MKQEKSSLLVLSFIPICIAINVIGVQIASMLKLPVYFDSIGTILVALLCGPLQGLIVGVLTCVVSAIFSPIMLAYIPATAVYGLLIGGLAKKNRTNSFGKLILTGILLAVTAVLMSSFITAFVFGGVTETGQSVIIVFLRSIGLELLPATMLSSLVTELFDKTISFLICYLIIRNMSARYLTRFPLGKVYIPIRGKK